MKGAYKPPAPMPAPRCKVKGGARTVAVYESVHRAWRAGVIGDFYYGTRSDEDSTLIWLVDGVELAGPDLAGVSTLVERACVAAGVADLAWGALWCGYRALVVRFTAGHCVTQEYVSGVGVVETVTGRPALVAVA